MSGFRYGLTFNGFNGVLARHMVPRNQLAGNPADPTATESGRAQTSVDWAFDPTEGKWIRRAGSAILGDTL